MTSSPALIIHQLPVPQSLRDGIRAACGLLGTALRKGDTTHRFAGTDRPEDVTCVGCLAVRDLAAAREALGAWTPAGGTLADGIRAKVARLEDLAAVVDAMDALCLSGDAHPGPSVPAEDLLAPADPRQPTVAVPRDLLDALVYDHRQGLAIEHETVDVLAELLAGGAT